MSTGRVRRGRVAPGGTDARWAVQVAGRLVCTAVAVVLAAFLWPVGLGGCTSLVTVPAGGAGPGFVPGDVLVTRCDAPGVGDRVVHRAADGAWVVARVVAHAADGWQLSAADGARWTAATGDLGRVLTWRVDAPAPAVGAGGVVAVVALVTVAGRRLHALLVA